MARKELSEEERQQIKNTLEETRKRRDKLNDYLDDVNINVISENPTMNILVGKYNHIDFKVLISPMGFMAISNNDRMRKRLRYFFDNNNEYFSIVAR